MYSTYILVAFAFVGCILAVNCEDLVEQKEGDDLGPLKGMAEGKKGNKQLCELVKFLGAMGIAMTMTQQQAQILTGLFNASRSFSLV